MLKLQYFFIFKKVWNIETGELVMEKTDHKDSVTQIAFNGSNFVSGSKDKTLMYVKLFIVYIVNIIMEQILNMTLFNILINQLSFYLINPHMFIPIVKYFNI